jgi:hypothetical protein
MDDLYISTTLLQEVMLINWFEENMNEPVEESSIVKYIAPAPSG